MDGLPEISVIVPVYNVANFVGACLRSLREQTYTDFEVIVVDDGSTDTSIAEAQAAAEGDARFTFLSQPNAGLSAARNTGLAEAAGRFVAFVDSDDRVDPTFLEKMHTALEDTGAPWVACAVRMVRADDTVLDLPAIHGKRFPASDGVTEFLLDTWVEIIPLWPSAWNKLYRRDLIEGMRFVPGVLYEDHPWFQEAADRADRIAYIPEPLYWQTQGREGQITRDGGERVFEQFDVLERCVQIIKASDKPEATRAIAQLASRLLFERAGVISDPARRQRFAEEGSKFLAQHALDYSPDWDPAIAHSWGRVMAGEVPVTVVIATDTAGPSLRRSLASLGRQTLRDIEVLIVQIGHSDETRKALFEDALTLPLASVLGGPTTGDVADARNRGLVAARGHYLVFLDAGDVLRPQTLWLWVEAMLRSGAGLGLSQFLIGGPKGDVHVGTHDGLGPMGERLKKPHDEVAWHDRLLALTQDPHRVPPHRAIMLHALPSAKIFRRRRLLESHLRFAPGPYSSWRMILEAAHASRRMIRFDWPGVILSVSPEDRRVWRAQLPVAAIAEALEGLSPLLDKTMDPQDWRTTLFARAVWEKLNFAAFPDEGTKAEFCEAARAHALSLNSDPDDDLIDPYIGDRVRGFFRP